MFRQWARILRHPTFVAWALLIACTYGGLFALLPASGLVFIDVLGSSPMACGLYIAGCSMCYIVGTFWCRRWLLRHGLAGAVKRGAFFTLAGGVSMMALAWAGIISPWAIAVPQFIFAFGHGIHQPCGQTGVVAAFPKQAGAASALSGFLLAGTAFAIAAVLSWWTSLPGWAGTLYPMTLGVGLGGVCTAWVALRRVQRDGLPRRSA